MANDYLSQAIAEVIQDIADLTNGDYTKFSKGISTDMAALKKEKEKELYNLVEEDTKIHLLLDLQTKTNSRLSALEKSLADIRSQLHNKIDHPTGSFGRKIRLPWEDENTPQRIKEPIDAGFYNKDTDGCGNHVAEMKVATVKDPDRCNRCGELLNICSGSL